MQQFRFWIELQYSDGSSVWHGFEQVQLVAIPEAAARVVGRTICGLEFDNGALSQTPIYIKGVPNHGNALAHGVKVGEACTDCCRVVDPVVDVSAVSPSR